MNDASLILYTHPDSRGRVARWMLEEVGAPYQVQVIEFGPAQMKAPAYLAINPMGKVPALRHGDRTVTELAAICAYLAEAFPEAGLAPAVGEPGRADYLRWLFFVAGPLESAMMATIGKAELDPITAGHGRVEDVVNTLDKLLSSRSFVAGDHFSAADVMMCSYVDWYMEYKLLEARPSFQAYVAKHQRRAAAIRSNRLDDADSAARKAA